MRWLRIALLAVNCTGGRYFRVLTFRRAARCPSGFRGSRTHVKRGVANRKMTGIKRKTNF